MVYLGLPINSMVIFHGKLLNNQRVYLFPLKAPFRWGISPHDFPLINSATKATAKALRELSEQQRERGKDWGRSSFLGRFRPKKWRISRISMRVSRCFKDFTSQKSEFTMKNRGFDGRSVTFMGIPWKIWKMNGVYS